MRNTAPAPAPRGPWWVRGPFRFVLAFALLNALWTFESAGRFGIAASPRLSFELCLALLALLCWSAWRGTLGPRGVRAWAALAVLLALVRYADVTGPAMLGRPLNLLWDAPHAGEVLRLAAQAVPGCQLVAAGLLITLGIAAVFGLACVAVRVLANGVCRPAARPALLLAIAALSASYLAYAPQQGRDTRWFFALPLGPTIAREAARLPTLMWPGAAEATLPAGPSFDRNLAALRGADVLLVFAESYGMTSFEDPSQAAALAEPRAALARALAANGRGAVSARVRSPTFGGASWLAHAALLAGTDTSDPARYDALLASRRGTLVSHFARHGYRTVAWMPGLQRPWPEGAFYGFDRLAGAASLGYAGPDFGYWRIPDEAAMALLHAQELAGDAGRRAPRFAVFPTLATHAPFRPLAPLLGDWTRAGDPRGYTAAQRDAALAKPVSWRTPMPAYLDAMRYQFDWLASYLGGPAPRRLLTIVVGDHQPLAAISGPRASWDVPVHLISDDAALLQRFVERGFVPGLAPPPESLGPMDGLTRLLLEGFDAPPPHRALP